MNRLAPFATLVLLCGCVAQTPHVRQAEPRAKSPPLLKRLADLEVGMRILVERAEAVQRADAACHVATHDRVSPVLEVAVADGPTFVAPSSMADVTLRATFSDEGCGLDLTTLSVTVDDQDVAAQFVAKSGGAQGTVSLPVGSHTVCMTIQDGAGNVTRSQARFEVLPPPAVAFELIPTSSSTVAVATPGNMSLRAVTALGETAKSFTGFVLFSVSDGRQPLDGLLVEITATDNGQVELPDGVATFLTVGEVTVTAESLEPAPLNVSGSLAMHVTLDAPVVTANVPTQLPQSGPVSVFGFTFPGETVVLLVDDEIAAVQAPEAGGDYSLTAMIPAGAHQVTVRATNPTTGKITTSAPITVTVPQPVAPEPTPTASSEATIPVAQEKKMFTSADILAIFTGKAPEPSTADLDEAEVTFDVWEEAESFSVSTD